MNSKLEDLLIEFDEMGFEPTALCENPQEEVKSFRNRLKQVLLELQVIKEAEPTEALKCLRTLGNEEIAISENEPYYYKKLNYVYDEDFNIIEQALLNKSKKEELLDKLLETKIRPCYMLNGDKLYKIDEGLIVPDDKIYSLLEEVYKKDRGE